MAINYGKKFEKKFEEDFLKIPGALVYRLPDQMSGYKNVSKNPCDFICYRFPNILFIECKVVQYGNTLALSRITQLDKLSVYAKYKGSKAGVVAFFMEKKKVIFIPVQTLLDIIKDGKHKSVNIRFLESGEYELIDIPSKVRRVFLDSDYSILLEET